MSSPLPQFNLKAPWKFLAFLVRGKIFIFHKTITKKKNAVNTLKSIPWREIQKIHLKLKTIFTLYKILFYVTKLRSTLK